jgi:hypothetical protein
MAVDPGAPLAGIAATLAATVGEMKTGKLTAFDTQLSALYLQTVKAPQATTLTALANTPAEALHQAAGRSYVTIDVVARNGDGAWLLPKLQQIGLVGGAAFAGVVSGAIDVNRLGQLQALLGGKADGKADDLGSASVSRFVTHVGSVTNQADAAMRSDTVRTSYGVDGSGVKIGIISDSFDTATSASTHMGQDIASGDLPSAITILEDYPGGTDEGRAMGQIIHDIAPGASLLFATGIGGQAHFASNIIALADAGAQIIVDDLLYYRELYFQEGPIAQAVNQVAARGVSYLSAAGNDGAAGLQTSWVDGAAYSALGESMTLMRFTPSQPSADYLPIHLVGGEQLVLQWSNPGASAGGKGATADLDFFLTNQDGSVVAASSVTNNIGADPVEQIDTSALSPGLYYIRVGLVSGPAPAQIKVMASGATDQTFAQGVINNNFSTLYGHAAATGAVAVGATEFLDTPAFGVSSPGAEAYSGRGSSTILFDNAGNPLGAPSLRTVAFTAPDGGNTTFFGWDIPEDADTFPNFYGTSAAAPAAAALAALMWQSRPSLTAADLGALLSDSGYDFQGFFNGYLGDGVGLVDAGLALDGAKNLHINNPHRGVLVGTHLDDFFEVKPETIVNGGAGADTASFATYNFPLTIDLANAPNLTSIERIVGTPSWDTLFPALSGSYLDGGAGPDWLYSFSGDDVLIGGAGVDMAVYAGSTHGLTIDLRLTTPQNTGDGLDSLAGIENIIASQYADVITGDSAANSVQGNDGDNVLSGMGGDDQLWTGSGNDLLDGGDGNDALSDNSYGDDVLVGGAGNDSLGVGRDGFYFGPAASNTVSLTGGSGDDSLGVSLRPGSLTLNASLSGGDGDDLLTLSGPVTGSVDAGAGDDTIILDVLALTPAAVALGDGADVLEFRNPQDFGSRAPGAVTRVTGFTPGAAGDRVLFPSGTLQLSAQGNAFGASIQLVASGADTKLQTLSGTDLVVFLNTSLGQFTAWNFSGFGPDGSQVTTLVGSSGNEVLIGTDNSETLWGLGGGDDLTGGGGNDLLLGGAGNDFLLGEFGDDVLDGGVGDDWLTGGFGDDRFKGGGGADRVSDFSAGGSEDRLDLRGSPMVHTVSQALATASQSGPDTVLTLGGGSSVTLLGVTKTDLIAADFVLVEGHADLNGDGTGDLLWRRDDGRTYLWRQNADGTRSELDLGFVPREWKIQQTGDFNGDGLGDIAWRKDNNGLVYLWLFNASGAYSTVDLGLIPAEWKIKRAGDFNGDGTTDLAWRKDDGRTYLWLFNASGAHSDVDLGVIPTEWVIQQAGDFNGDAVSDLLWRRTTDGDVYLWKFSASGSHTEQDLGVVSADWKLQRAMDFNGDGVGDVLWQNTAGAMKLWSFAADASHVEVSLGSLPQGYRIADAADYNADGQADLMLRSASGQDKIWLLAADGTHTEQILTAVSGEWHVQGGPNLDPVTSQSPDLAGRDFNGDGLADAVLRNDNGDAQLWLFNSSGSHTNWNFGLIPPEWSIQQVADFNGDGIADILWRRSTDGTAYLWFMQAEGGRSEQNLGAVPSEWSIQSGADFNGDGVADILWRRSTDGDAYLWKLNADGTRSEQNLGLASTGWTFQGASDFNGDRRADILWRASDGHVFDWITNADGSHVQQDLGAVATDRHVAGTGDFNSDGRGDILWRHDDGQVSLWTSNGDGTFATLNLGSLATDWAVAKAADLDGDSRTDILWRNTVSGQLTAWTLDLVGGHTSIDFGLLGAGWHFG